VDDASESSEQAQISRRRALTQLGGVLAGATLAYLGVGCSGADAVTESPMSPLRLGALEGDARAAVAAATTPAREYGFYLDGVRGATPATTDVTYLQTLQATVCRTMLPMYDVEATQGVYTDTAVDAFVNAFSAAGIDQILCFWGSASWCNGSTTSTVVPTYLSDQWTTFVDGWTALATREVTRYMGQVHKWELWNEPNQHFNWQEPSYPDVTSYVAWASAMYAAIKAADPTCTVVIGGLCGLVAGPSTDYAGETFLQDCYAAGFYADGVAIHPYCKQAPSTRLVAHNNSFGDIATVHTIMVNAGHGSDALWVTEFGYPGTSDRIVAGYLTTAFDLIASTFTYVSVFCWFILQEDASYPTSGGISTTGAVTAVGTAFKNFVDPPAPPARSPSPPSHRQ
jgi:hypothetical protein